LNGNWSFYKVNNGNPVTKNCFCVPVPGSWKDIPELREYNGIGFYEKTFTIKPESTFKRAFIRFGSVFRSANVKLNGITVGEHSGFQSPFTFEITNAVKTGENILTVEVDSTRHDGDLFGSSSIAELIPLHFDGISQPVTVMLTEHIFVKDIYTPIDLETNTAFLQLSLSSNLKNSVKAEINVALSVSEDEMTLNINDCVNIQPGESTVTLHSDLDKIKPWSPDEPILYNAVVRITAESVTDENSFIVGFKSFSVKDKDFLLNGQPIYLLGYGDDAVYPDGNPSATDSSFYEYGLIRAKEYGFNFVRFHSHFPFESMMDACDRIGMLIQPELALANVSRELFTAENQEIFIRQWQELIASYRRHPCIAAWCGGNEMEWGFPFQQDLYDISKEVDPFRPVQSTDGNFAACDVNETQDYAGIVPAEYTDYLPYGELSEMFTRDDCGKPQVVHEMGNYATVFNINDLPRWQKSKLTNSRIEQMNRLVTENGQQELYEKALKNSFSLQKMCHKLNIEKVRLSPNFSGYHLWTLTDYYETTQGLLNSFYDDKAYTPSEFAVINSQNVLLWDTQSFVFSAGKTSPLLFYISKYGSNEMINGLFTVSLNDKIIFSKNISLSGHGLMLLAETDVTLPETEKEEAYNLSVRLDYGDTVLTNGWTLLSVPQIAINREKEIYIHYLSRHIFERDSTPVRHFTIPQPIGSEQLIVTDCLYGGMIDAVASGASMLLLERPGMFHSTVNRNSFKTPWWDPGEIWYLNHTNNRQASCVVEEHPATAMLPYSGVWQFDLFNAVEQADAVDLDACGVDVEPLIYGVDINLHRLGYLFQFGYGKGKILVCTFNHSRKDIQSISLDYQLRSLINYAMSDDFKPKKTLSPDELKKIIR